MESLFFNLSDRGYQHSFVYKNNSSYIKRVDVSQGLLFFDIELKDKKFSLSFKYIDSTLMIIVVKSGFLEMKNEVITPGMNLLISTKQDFNLNISKNSRALIIFIADFYLKQFLNSSNKNPANLLYSKLQENFSLKNILSISLNPHILYLTNSLLKTDISKNNSAIKIKLQLLEILLYAFEQFKLYENSASDFELELVKKIQDTLSRQMQNPPTIKELSHICSVNETKLKKVFKKVTNSTIRSYLQDIRLEFAHTLFKTTTYTKGEIAKKVGYNHQSYFSTLYKKKYSKSDK